ncbi:MAG: peptide chain release factor N(5)-glutamine methyltransferase [Candidatus Omnitrophica bacterium]|nr:peptide chain release factor N(5)-glutamine methyltransferase [Candidatus Omnitrophota bacterium]
MNGIAMAPRTLSRTRQLLQAAAETLRHAGVEEPERQAALLLAAVLGTSPTRLYADDGDISEDAQGRFLELVAGRATRQPLQYLLGEAEFCGRTFLVDGSVLIPRPETAVLVEAAVARLRAQAGRAIELGTGSGAIAVTLAAELPACVVEATELSAAALAVARANARVQGLAGRIRFQLGDLFAGVPAAHQHDVVISNPPYVPSQELDRLMPEVRCEPRVALEGGPDGTSVLRRIIERAPAYLRDGGWLLLECGQGQAEVLMGVARSSSCWRDGEICRDDGGIDRVVILQRNG